LSGVAGTFTCTVCLNAGPNTIFVPTLNQFLCPTCLAIRVSDGSVECVPVGGKTDVRCVDCGDLIDTDDSVYCGACGNHEDCSYGSEAYCHECGEEADVVRCSSHPLNACDECAEDASTVLCETCATDIWGLADVTPAVILGKDGVMTVDGMEVNWT